MVMLAIPRALEKGPEALDGVGMGRAVGIGLAVLDDGMGNGRTDRPVGAIFVGDEKGAGGVDRFADEAENAPPGQVIGDSRDDSPAPFDRADDRRLPGAAATGGGG